jgi:hypothetical protein
MSSPKWSNSEAAEVAIVAAVTNPAGGEAETEVMAVDEAVPSRIPTGKLIERRIAVPESWGGGNCPRPCFFSCRWGFESELQVISVGLGWSAKQSRSTKIPRRFDANLRADFNAPTICRTIERSFGPKQSVFI